MTLCPTCHQPECDSSTDDEQRPLPGALPTLLELGQREYRGYGEWAIHPEEATFLLHRGYAIVDGRRTRVEWIHNEAFATQVRVEGTFTGQRPLDAFVDSARVGAQ